MIVLVIAAATSYGVVKVFSEKLVDAGCVMRSSHEPRTHTSCFDGMLATGAVGILATLAWWTLFGLLDGSLVEGSKKIWLPLRRVAMCAGVGMGAMVVALYVVPVVILLFAYIVIPLFLAVVAGVAALVLALIGLVRQ